MKIRMYSDEDIESLVAVFTSSVHELSAPHYDAAQREAWAPIPPDLDAWRRRLSALHTIVAEEAGSCIGFLAYEADGHIVLLFTDPAAARRGVASALLREATRQLSAGGKVAEIFTEASLTARPFFLRHGFEVTAEQTVTRQGIRFCRFAMRRPIHTAS
jgi:putative acetyltransferase